MQLKNDYLHVRINKDIKEQYRSVVEKNGSSISTALNKYIFNEIKQG